MIRLPPLIFNKSITLIALLVIFSLLFGSWLGMSIKKISIDKNSPIAEVSYLLDGVSRRYSYLPFWQQLLPYSFIEHLDELNSNQSSLTLLSMHDGSSISIGKESLLRLKRWKKSSSVMLTHGTLSIKNSTSPLQIEMLQGTLRLKPMTSMSIMASNEAIVITVFRGTVQLKGFRGHKQVEAGQQAVIKEGYVTTKNNELSPLKPFLNDLYYTDPSLTAFVDFKINQAADSRDRVEIGTSPLFTEGVMTIEPQNNPPSLSARLEPGHYFWRYERNNSYSEVMNFTVAALEVPQLHNPDPTEFKLASSLDAVILYWEDSPLYQSYRIELSLDRLFTEPLEQHRAKSSPLSLYHLPSGSYFYRVVGETHNQAVLATSETRQFIVSNHLNPLALKPLLPPNDLTLDAIGERHELFFNWQSGDHLDHQELVIATNPSLSSPLIRQKSDHNFISLLVPTDPSTTYYWRLEATTEQGEKIYSEVSSYRFAHVPMINPTRRESDGIALDIVPIVTERELEKRPDLALTLLQPLGNSRINTIAMDQIGFRWQASDATSVDFELSSNPDFTTLVSSKKNLQGSTTSITAPAPGRYYWRLRYNVDGNNLFTPPSTFIIEWLLPPIQLLSPQQGSSFQTSEASRGLSFRWSAPRAKNFVLTIAHDELFSRPIFSHQGTETMLTLPPLDKGNYYAKIEGTALNGAIYPATIHSFAIEPYRPAAPTDLTPDKKAVVNMSDQDSLIFTWVASDEVTDSSLILYRLDKTVATGRQSIHTKTLIKENSYRFNRLTQLSEGDFYWTIQSFTRSASNTIIASSAIAEGFFSLSLDPLPPPTINSPATFRLSDSPSQRISWNSVDKATRYHVIIRTNDERQVKVIDTTTASLFITPRLAARSYSGTITAVTKFGKASTNSTSFEITVDPS